MCAPTIVKGVWQTLQRTPLRQCRRQDFLESEDRGRLQIHSVKVTAKKLLLLHQRKTGSIAQHMGYVKRVIYGS